MVFGAVQMQCRALQNLARNFHRIGSGTFIGSAFDDFVGADTMATIANEMTALADGRGRNMSSAQGADSVRCMGKVGQRSTANQTAVGLVDNAKHLLSKSRSSSTSSVENRPPL